MSMTAAKAQAKIEALKGKLVLLGDELIAAQAREVLTIGDEYPIFQGRGEERSIHKAKLLAQRVAEDGTTHYAFQLVESGEFAQGTSRIIATEPKEGEEGAQKVRSSDKVKTIIDRLTADLEAAEKDLEEALAREHLEVNGTYSIKVGRGKTADVVLAVLLGIGTVTRTKKQIVDGVEKEVEVQAELLNFFYGAGFEARTVLVPRGSVVFSTAEDNAEAGAAADAEEHSAEQAADAQG